MSVAGTKNFDQPPHDSNRTHLVFSTSGLLLGSRAPLVFSMIFVLEIKKLKKTRSTRHRVISDSRLAKMDLLLIYK